MSVEDLAQKLFEADWPNDKWKRFKDGDHAKERYLKMSRCAFDYFNKDAS